ncbi:hypothetical protein CBR_g29368 [Chara braunii]|uniref:Reverse transcriptase domain-containing protein n=1 Tax=Chara braunii TaxID=69332 RepID=A0A388JWJ5_CHABU|nr:hypothetical protein CBR_g29368 [Chara braunii]|eukprot:GBG62169.1 hypothetical protein CBR_g29368 [Chara braunii]
MASQRNQGSQHRHRPPGPPDPRSEDDRVRDSVGRCYDEGICPEDLDIGEVVEDENDRRFVVNSAVGEIKKQWLKERTVILIFQEEAKKLSRSVKEDLVRAYEDGWLAEERFHPDVRKGRVSFEGANVVSYVANAKEVAQWLIRQGEIKLRLADEEYTTVCKPWMTRNELKEIRLQEAATNFWIIALRVPLEAYYYLWSAVSNLFGEVRNMHPPEFDRSRPKLMNVKLDMDPESRYDIEDELVIQGPAGERGKVEIATPYTDWCRRCRWYFHTEENCPRSRQDDGRRREGPSRPGGHRERFMQFIINQPRRAEAEAGGGRGERQEEPQRTQPEFNTVEQQGRERWAPGLEANGERKVDLRGMGEVPPWRSSRAEAGFRDMRGDSMDQRTRTEWDGRPGGWQLPEGGGAGLNPEGVFREVWQNMQRTQDLHFHGMEHPTDHTGFQYPPRGGTHVQGIVHPAYPQAHYPDRILEWRSSIPQGPERRPEAQALFFGGCTNERQGANEMGMRRRGGAWRTWREEEPRDMGEATWRERSAIAGDHVESGDRRQRSEQTRGLRGEASHREGRQGSRRPEGIPEEEPGPNLSRTPASSHSRVRMGSEWLGPEGTGEERRDSRSVADMERSSCESSAQSKKQGPTGDEGSGRRTTVRDRREMTTQKDQVEVAKRRLVPLLCTMANNGIYLLAVADNDGQPLIPSVEIDKSPTVAMIMEMTRVLYGNHVPTRIIPKSSMVSIFCDTPEGYFKVYFPLLDARIPPETAELLTQSGIRWYRMDVIRERNLQTLEGIRIAPGINGDILLKVSEKLEEDEGLQSAFMTGREGSVGSHGGTLNCGPIQNPETRGLRIHLDVTHPQEQTGRDSKKTGLLVSEGVMEGVTSVYQVGNPMSDHKPVVANIKLRTGLERGSGFFRLNSRNLKEPGLIEWVQRHMTACETAREHFGSTAEWVDSGIGIISKVMDVSSRILARSRNKKEAECRRRVEEAEEKMEGHPITVLAWAAEREKRMAEWEKLQVEKEKWRKEVLEEKGIVTHDKMTRETFQKLQPRRTHLQMVELRHPADAMAPRATTASGMLEYAKIFYEDILTTRRPQDDTNTDLTLVSDMWNDTGVRLSTQARLDLDRPVTVEETKQTLRNMARGKSPGADGLTVEFYTKSWSWVGPILVALFNEVLDGGKLGSHMTFGIITLLFKKGDKAEVKNWRPISLLNVSYKILAKTLARRLARYLPDLVGEDQGAFVQGRSIFNNIVTAIEVLEIVQSENLDMAVLLLDLEKAYDKVGWTFVLTTLRHMGFGRGFCSWVTAMYTFSTSSVVVNGHISAPFRLTRSLRQGCPLAPLLFVLQMEVLLNRIRRHPDIRGLQLHNRKDCTVKALADDLLAVCENTVETLVALKDTIREYSELSEASVNWGKSTFLLPKSYALKVEWGMRRVEEGEEERFLGVLISLHIQESTQGLLLQQRIAARLNLWGRTWHLSIVGRALVANAALLTILWFVSQNGTPFVADGSAATFGLAWVRKGVSRIRDLWSQLLGSWEPLAKIKRKLSGLHKVEENWIALIRAIPQEWVQLLGPEGIDPPGTWYIAAQEEEPGVVWKVEEVEPSGFRRVEKWKAAEHTNTLERIGEGRIMGWANPPQIRVVSSEGTDRRTRILTWIGRTPLRELNIDPVAWFNRLWETLKSLPNGKQVSILWLLSLLVAPSAVWLVSRGMEVDLRCRRCNWPFESTRHLWWECPASKRIWKWWEYHWRTIGGQGVVWDERWVLLGFLKEEVSTKSGWGYIAHVIRGILCEVIWSNRNRARFEGRPLSDVELKARIKHGVKQAISVDWRRTVRQGRSGRRQKNWFLNTWARGNKLAAVHATKGLVISQWIQEKQLNNDLRRRTGVDSYEN